MSNAPEMNANVAVDMFGDRPFDALEMWPIFQ
jgi:hypothetical protein